MPLFRKKDHTAEDEAARTHFEQLMALSPADLAAELMPAFGPDGPRHGKNLNILQPVSWLLRGHRGAGGVSDRRQLVAAVREAAQVLEHAELVQARHLGGQSGGSLWNATRLGAAALANADYRQHIKDRPGL
jgi:hypothetical protein